MNRAAAAARPCYPAGGLVRADARWLPSWTSWRRDLAPPPAQRTDGPRRREPRRAGRRAAGLGARGKRRRAPRRGRPGASPRAHAVQGDRAPRTGRDRAHHRGVRRRDQRLDELRPDRLPRGGRQPVPGAGPGRPRRRDHLGGVRPRRAAARERGGVRGDQAEPRLSDAKALQGALRHRVHPPPLRPAGDRQRGERP